MLLMCQRVCCRPPALPRGAAAFIAAESARRAAALQPVCAARRAVLTPRHQRPPMPLVLISFSAIRATTAQQRAAIPLFFIICRRGECRAMICSYVAAMTRNAIAAPDFAAPTSPDSVLFFLSISTSAAAQRRSPPCARVSPRLAGAERRCAMRERRETLAQNAEERSMACAIALPVRQAQMLSRRYGAAPHVLPRYLPLCTPQRDAYVAIFACPPPAARAASSALCCRAAAEPQLLRCFRRRLR